MDCSAHLYILARFYRSKEARGTLLTVISTTAIHVLTKSHGNIRKQSIFQQKRRNAELSILSNSFPVLSHEQIFRKGFLKLPQTVMNQAMKEALGVWFQ